MRPCLCASNIIVSIMLTDGMSQLYIQVEQSCNWGSTCIFNIPTTMFLYQVITSSFVTSGSPLVWSTITPSESMTLYVGIASFAEGVINDISVVNLLLIAPGNRTL